MEKKYILAIDQSTSGTKAILFNKLGEKVHRYSTEHRQFYPQPGWVEQDPEEIYVKTLQAIRGVLEETGTSLDKVYVLSITNQRETVVVWDKNTGKPVHNAVVWQCKRGLHICSELKEQGFEKLIQDKTGLILSPYFSAAKIKWILDNVEGVRERADSGQLLFGNIDTWLIWKLTNHKVHATDFSNASRTQLFNIHELQWDQELLDLFTIPKSMAPDVKYSDEIFGYTAVNDIFSLKVPISGVMGDSHAALFGHNCLQKGLAKATYGTGSSVMMNIGRNPIRSQQGLVTSIAWGAFNEVNYVLEGNINCTGAAIKWLVDNLELIADSKESGELAGSLKGNDGVYLVPAFTGLGAPYWDSKAKALIMGMTLSTKKAHLVRAAEESIAYQIKDIVDLMVAESGIQLKELRVDGGATRDAFLMQFQADMLNVSVVRNQVLELSALGSALMGGLATGMWSSIEEVQNLRVSDAVFEPKIDAKLRDILYDGWKEAVQRTRSDNYNLKLFS